MERLSLRGRARGSTRELLQQLEREITPALLEHAASCRQLEHVRQACRLSVAEFVRLWLEREGQWHAGGLTTIQVRFFIGKSVNHVSPYDLRHGCFCLFRGLSGIQVDLIGSVGLEMVLTIGKEPPQIKLAPFVDVNPPFAAIGQFALLVNVNSVLAHMLLVL
jgi:hypothetical protein